LLAAHGNMDRVAYDLFGDELTLDGAPLRDTLNAIRDAQPKVPEVLRRRSTDKSVLIKVHDTVRGLGGAWLPSPTVADGFRPDYFARLADGRYLVLQVSELLDPTESEAADAASEAQSVAQESCAQLGLAVFAAASMSPPTSGTVGLSELAAALAPR
jgi:hypothetical protein